MFERAPAGGASGLSEWLAVNMFRTTLKARRSRLKEPVPPTSLGRFDRNDNKRCQGQQSENGGFIIGAAAPSKIPVYEVGYRGDKCDASNNDKQCSDK